MTKFQRIILYFFIVISLVGMADAGYLTYEHYAPFPLPCSNFACETVTNSEYSVIFGVVPLALLGLLYYISFFLGSVITLVTKNKLFLKALSLYSSVGFLTSLYLVYLQLFVLDAICIYCMISAGTSTSLFIIGLTYLLKQKSATTDD